MPAPEKVSTLQALLYGFGDDMYEDARKLKLAYYKWAGDQKGQQRIQNDLDYQKKLALQISAQRPKAFYAGQLVPDMLYADEVPLRLRNLLNR